MIDALANTICHRCLYPFDMATACKLTYEPQVSYPKQISFE